MKLSLLLILFLQLPLFAQEEYLYELEQNIHVQILLDQAGFSPGEIDGKIGDNTLRALILFQSTHGLPRTGEADDRTLDRLTEASGRTTLTHYRLTSQDAALESISEQFHLSPEIFRLLNPEAKLVPGETVLVPNIVNHTQVAAKPKP